MELNDTYSSAIEKAMIQFRGKDSVLMSRNSGAVYEGKEFSVRFLNENYLISYPEGDIKDYGERKASPEIQILLLHYLSGSKDIPPSGKLISFRELPGGVSYEKAFYDRAVVPIIREFEDRPEGFISSSERLGGTRLEIGDFAYAIPALPRIPLTYVLNLGDEEIPSAANLLFDSSSSLHLPTEGLAALGELTTERLIES